MKQGRTAGAAVVAALAWVAVTALTAGGGCRERGSGPPAGAFPPDRRTPSAVAGDATWRAVHAEFLDTCGIRTDGSLWCWGRNTTGQLGDGTREPHGAPRRVGGDADWLSVELGDHFTCGLRADRDLWCWGDHENGAPGRGDRVANPLPERVDLRDDRTSAPLAFAAFSVGDGHVCGLATDGTAWCWGKPGPLGDGAHRHRPAPVRVDVAALAPPPRFAEIVTGTYHTCARAEDGRVFCWGEEDHGQVGDGGAPDDERESPVAVAAPPDLRFLALSASTYHTCAVARDGAAWCWGANAQGQLGLGDRNDRTAPARLDPAALPAGTTFRAIDCGFDQTCAIDQAGGLWCWGGSRPDSPLVPTPVRSPDVPPTARYSAVSVGVSHACALTDDGRAWCWGVGSDGQLGLAEAPGQVP